MEPPKTVNQKGHPMIPRQLRAGARRIATVLAAGAVMIALGGATATAAAAAAPQRTAESDGIIVVMDKPSSTGIGTLSADTPSDDVIMLLDDADALDGLEGAGLAVTHASVVGDDVMMSAQPAEGQTDAEALVAAQRLEGVEHAQLNYVYHLIDSVDDGVSPAEGADAAATAATGASAASPTAAATTTGASTLATRELPNDPFTQVSEPTTSRGNQYWAYSTGLVDAWQQATCEGSATVAVLDSGVLLGHEDLRDNVLADLAYDATLDMPLAEAPVQDATNHGTSVAAIIAATADNGIGLAGASYNAKLLPVKVMDNTSKHTITTESLTAAYNYLFRLVDEGTLTDLRVINMSLGGYGDSATDELFHQAIQTARSRYGILSVCAGGNGEIPEGGSTRVPVTEHMYPSDFEECIAVTALEVDGTNIYWSDYNESKDISAPGRSIWSASATSSSAYFYNNGTSEAAPMVSGAILLMYAVNPDATPDEVCEVLYDTADPVVDPMYDRTQTSGSHGMLDADEAVARMAELAQEDPTPSFSDVAEGDWYFGAVTYVSSRGIMNGYGDTGVFGPEDTLTRAQVAIALYNYLGKGEVCAAAPFTDVAQDSYAAAAINWVYAHGYMTGYDDGTGRFGPDDGLLREQLVRTLYNIAYAPGSAADAGAFYSMPDWAEVDTWAQPSMIWALDQQVIGGVVDETGTRFIRPLNTVSRAELATMLMNCLEGGVL